MATTPARTPLSAPEGLAHLAASSSIKKGFWRNETPSSSTPWCAMTLAVYPDTGRDVEAAQQGPGGSRSGSCARDTHTPDSDIDLAIFLEKDELDGFEEDALLMKLRRKVDLRIEPHAFARSDFDPTNPEVREILSYGERIL